MRIIRALFNVAKAAQAETSAYDKFLYKANGWCKYGLKKDDLLSEHSKDVVEALRRCPEEIVYQRIFRQNRAAQLSMTHTILPEAEWTKIEEDTPYLQPYVDEVKAEKEEKATWEEKNPL